MLVCVPLVTLNLASLLLGRKWASAALGRKTAFGRSPRVHWEGRGQRISVSPRHGTGCEEIVGNVNNGTKRRRAAAGSPCSRTIWISMLEKIKSNYASLFFKLKQWHLWRQWRLFNLYTIRIQRNGEDYWVFLSLILMFNKHKQPKRTNQCSCSLHVSVTPTVTPTLVTFLQAATRQLSDRLYLCLHTLEAHSKPKARVLNSHLYFPHVSVVSSCFYKRLQLIYFPREKS